MIFLYQSVDLDLYHRVQSVTKPTHGRGYQGPEPRCDERSSR